MRSYKDSKKRTCKKTYKKSNKKNGFTLLETLIALALIAVISILTANLINSLISSRDVFRRNETSSVVTLWQFTLPLKNSLETIVKRRVQENMKHIDAPKIIWTPDLNTISWVSNSGFAFEGGDNYSRLRRKRVIFQNETLYLQSTGELDSPEQPKWETEALLRDVTSWQWYFYEGHNWGSSPTDNTQGAKLVITYLGKEAQQTFFFATY